MGKVVDKGEVSLKPSEGCVERLQLAARCLDNHTPGTFKLLPLHKGGDK